MLQSIYRSGLLLALLAAGVTACVSKPFPTTAQRGSTIMLPLGLGVARADVGYGGTALEDPQRGEMLYRLDDPDTGFPLSTRVSSVVAAAPQSTLAYDATSFPPFQFVSMVDIPTDAPLGTHTVYPKRVIGGQETQVAGAGSYLEIKILPESITVPLAGGGTEEIVAAPSPFEARVCLFGCSIQDLSDDLGEAIPKPMLSLDLEDPVWSLEASIFYDESVIDVLDVQEPPGQALKGGAIVWWEEDPSISGHVIVRASATTRSIGAIGLVFALDDSATPLDPATVTVFVSRATDASGESISPVPQVQTKSVY